MLLPLLFRCRPLGCVYLLAPWDIHAALGKAALQEAAALLASGTFKALLAGGPLQQQWYAQVLNEGPMPAPAPPALPAPSSAGAAVAAELVAAQGQVQQEALSSGNQATPAAAHAAGLAGSVHSAGGDQPRSGHRGHPSADDANGYGSSEGLGQGSCASHAANISSAVQGQHTAAVAPAMPYSDDASASTASMRSSSTNACVPLPLSTAAAAAQAAAAAEAAAVSAAAMAPVGLPVSGHACGSFPELVLWPELLDIKDDLARSRHTAVRLRSNQSHCELACCAEHMAGV